jgi:predicted cobalt transporter CbtA
MHPSLYDIACIGVVAIIVLIIVAAYLVSAAVASAETDEDSGQHSPDSHSSPAPLIASFHDGENAR